MYFLGDTEAAEEAVANWCRANGLKYALAGFSAAWRLAADVRSSWPRSMSTIVDSITVLDKLAKFKGGKHIKSGANLLLWRPFDRSVLAGSRSGNTTVLPVTSATQTYLDLKRLAGRGEEAAGAVLRATARWPPASCGRAE